jgi:ABC-type transport system substrate-binding protein
MSSPCNDAIRKRYVSRRRLLGTALSAGTAMAVANPVLSTPTIAAALQDSAAENATPLGQTGGAVSVNWTKPSFLNPLFSSSGSEQVVEQQILGALVKMTAALEPVPDLAEKIDISPDARVYTFHLKKDLKFTDGQPFTAQDVIFTFERAVDQRTGSFWQGRLLELEGAAEYSDQRAESISGLEAIDDYTVKMTLTQPDSVWLITLADFAGLGILPAHALKDIPPDQLAQASFTFAPEPSAGAFAFDEWKPDQYLSIKRFDDYGGGPPAKLDQIFLKVLRNADVGIAQLENGEIDVMSVAVPEMERLQENDNLSVTSAPSPSVAYITCNLDRPFLQEKRVRQAIAYALDRESMVEVILKGQAQIINSIIYGPNFGPAWMGEAEGLNEYQYDPDQAKQLLEDAGWDGSQQVTLHFVPGDPITDALMPIVQQQLQEVGITINLVTVDTPESNRRVVASATTDHAGDYDIWLNAGGGIFGVDPNMSAKHFTTAGFTPSGGNFSHFSDPTVDDLYKQGRATADVAERKKAYVEIAKILNEEVPWIILWTPNSIFATTQRVQGFTTPAKASNVVADAEMWSVTE